MGSFNRRGEYFPRTLVGKREWNKWSVRLGFWAAILFAGGLALFAVARAYRA